jgi:hypothetical protein
MTAWTIAGRHLPWYKKGKGEKWSVVTGRLATNLLEKKVSTELRKQVLRTINRWLDKGADSRNPPRKIRQIRSLLTRGPSSWDEPLVSEEEVRSRLRVVKEHQAPINARR